MIARPLLALSLAMVAAPAMADAPPCREAADNQAMKRPDQRPRPTAPSREDKMLAPRVCTGCVPPSLWNTGMTRRLSPNGNAARQTLI
jgi:hypothetical protein